MMMEALGTRGERWLWNICWLTVLFFALTMIVGLMTYERGHALMQSYGAALIFALIGVCLCRRAYRSDRVYALGLVFAAWYALTRVLNGDHYLQYDYNQYRVVCMAATYGLAFPLAAMLGDEGKAPRAGPRRRGAHSGDRGGVLAGRDCRAAGRGHYRPVFGSQFGIMEDGRLYVLSQHPNFTAAFSLCGLCMLIYLVVSRWKLWVLIPAAAAGAGMFMALPLSDSRTGMIAFLLCVVIAAAVGFQRLPIPAKWRRIAGIACVVVLVAVVAVAGFGAAVKVVSTTSDGEQVISQRSLLADLATLTGRTDVYAAVPATFAQHPLAMLKGFDELEMMPAVNDNVEMHYNHMHNSFLQTLMLTGVPGLLAALWLTWRIVSALVRVLVVRGGGITPAQKLLVLLPAALIVQGMLEHYLFVDSYSILNFLFFLFSGYVVRLGRQVSWQQAFPTLARRQKA